jgi:hypothetical protein
MLRLVVKNGANVNVDLAIANDGYSYATLHGHTTIMRILVECCIKAHSDDRV